MCIVTPIGAIGLGHEQPEDPERHFEKILLQVFMNL